MRLVSFNMKNPHSFTIESVITTIQPHVSLRTSFVKIKRNQYYNLIKATEKDIFFPVTSRHIHVSVDAILLK